MKFISHYFEKRARAVLAGMLVCALCLPAMWAQKASGAGAFAPLQQWKAAVAAGNTTALKALYSSNPPARIASPAGDGDADTEAAFWTGLKARRIDVDVLQSNSQTGLQQVVFQATVHSGPA